MAVGPGHALQWGHWGWLGPAGGSLGITSCSSPTDLGHCLGTCTQHSPTENFPLRCSSEEWPRGYQGATMPSSPASPILSPAGQDGLGLVTGGWPCLGHAQMPPPAPGPTGKGQGGVRVVPGLVGSRTRQRYGHCGAWLRARRVLVGERGPSILAVLGNKSCN